MKATTSELGKSLEKDANKCLDIFCGIFCGFNGLSVVSIRKAYSNTSRNTLLHIEIEEIRGMDSRLVEEEYVSFLVP